MARRAEAPRTSLRINLMESGSEALLSPDGETLLVRNSRDLVFAPVNGGASRTAPLGGPEPESGRGLVWSSDSRSVWFLAGETTRSGFVAGPLRCARRFRDSRVEYAPALRGSPGRLDQVTWVDGDGLGIAHLDTRGGHHRPELPDDRPTLAVIHARTGAVRSALPLRQAIISTWGEGHGSVHLKVLAATRLPDGRVRAILRCGLDGNGGEDRRGGVALWTEGSPLRQLPPALGEPLSCAVFTPKGETILVSHPLSAGGVILEHRPSPAPTPVHGRYAALYDLSGRPIWTLESTAEVMRSPSPAAVRGDGRMGLVSLPETCGNREIWGVIDLRQGRIERRLGVLSNRAGSAGFSGATPWLASYQTLSYFGG